MPWAPCNGTTSTPPKLVVMLAPNHSTLQWHSAMAPRPLPQSWPSPIAHYNTMAPSNGTTSTPPKFHSPPNHSTLQWHPAMAPRPLPQSWSSPSPQPYHTTMAPYDGTQQWHHVHSPKVGRQPPPSTHTTMAMCNGTQQWHHVHCTLQWHTGATSNQPKWFVANPRPTKTPPPPPPPTRWKRTCISVFPLNSWG